MRKLLLSALLVLLSVAGAWAQSVGPAPILCNKVYQVAQGATALTKIVTGTSTTSISLCGWAVNAGAAAGTAQLEYGTGTNCGTGTTALTPAVSLGVNGSYVDHTVYVAQSLPQNTDLCLVTTGTGPVQIMIYYGQY